jgi:hypothetical protein
LRPATSRCLVVGLQLLALMSLGVSGSAADARSARARVVVRLPDWSGIWETQAAAAQDHGTAPATPQLWGEPPYTDGDQPIQILHARVADRDLPRMGEPERIIDGHPVLHRVSVPMRRTRSM